MTKSKKIYEEGQILTYRIPKNDEETLKWINSQSIIGKSISILINNEIERSGIVDLSKDDCPRMQEMISIVFDIISNYTNKDIGDLGVAVQEVYIKVIQQLNLDPDIIFVESDSNPSIFKNRIRWVLNRLKDWGLIEGTARGFYKLSDFGSIIKKNQITVDKDFQSILESNYINKTLV